MKRFEDELGARLFLRPHRKQRQTLPTSFALAIRPHLEQIIASLEQTKLVAALLSGTEPTGDLVEVLYQAAEWLTLPGIPESIAA
jgi:DNA-binding transcriptional LysR family regulator